MDTIMSVFGKSYNRLVRWLKRKRLQPIRVFVFHHVSTEFDETTMKIGDWSEISVFKENITKLKTLYQFISLKDAYCMIEKDIFRRKKYAVLTSDDGWLSLKNILPWLEQEKIHTTLFVNPCYFDGEHYRERATERYLSFDDINSLNSKYVSIGMHGWEHKDVTIQIETEFIESVKKSIEVLKILDNFIPYFCYTWGKYNTMTSIILKELNIIPVLTDGNKNYNESYMIHREVIDGIKL